MSMVSLFEDIQMPRDKMTHKNVSAPNTKVELRTKRRWSFRAIRLRLDTPAFRLRLRPSVKGEGELRDEPRTLTTRPMLGASPTILVFELP
jgi:hypothetical protein